MSLKVDRCFDDPMSVFAGDFLCVCDHYYVLTVLSEFVIVALRLLVVLHRIELLFLMSLAKLNEREKEKKNVKICLVHRELLSVEPHKKNFFLKN